LESTTSRNRGAARRRALRAARAVTLGLVTTASGCYLAHDVELEVDDAGADAAMLAFCVFDGEDWEAYSRCCDENGWNWERGCTAWGPFVPPGESA
jgi:hypothetical protein